MNKEDERDAKILEIKKSYELRINKLKSDIWRVEKEAKELVWAYKLTILLKAAERDEEIKELFIEAKEN